jgi:hypothetical protein
LIVRFFIISYYLCYSIASFIRIDSSFNLYASVTIFICWAAFYCKIAYLCCSFIALFYIILYSSSYSLYNRIYSFLYLSSSFLYLTSITYSALRLVSWIFFHAFFSSNFNNAIRFANRRASSAAFFLFNLVALRAYETSLSIPSPSSPYIPSSVWF